jgi:CheY-like chemotaxis protein
LIVEDNQDTREILCAALEHEGYAVLQAENGRDALSVLAAQTDPVRLIVSDLDMPEMSGAVFIRILSNYFRLSRIPVVVISGVLPPEEPTFEGKVVGVLRKPFELRALLNLIEANGEPTLN